jgi:hypothetical protein
VSEHNGLVAFAIQIGANSSTIFSGECDGLLCDDKLGQRKGEEPGSKGWHAGIIQGLAQMMNKSLQVGKIGIVVLAVGRKNAQTRKT